ncbi:E3 SUMO-protein ligase KIAA1586-like [Pleurodeles waltl]
MSEFALVYTFSIQHYQLLQAFTLTSHFTASMPHLCNVIADQSNICFSLFQFHCVGPHETLRTGKVAGVRHQVATGPNSVYLVKMSLLKWLHKDSASQGTKRKQMELECSDDIDCVVSKGGNANHNADNYITVDTTVHHSSESQTLLFTTSAANDFREVDLPDCWNIEQMQYFCKEYSWLIVENKKLGCSTCRSLKSLGANKTQGLRLAQEWSDCNVTHYGKEKFKQQMSLRKKIREHKFSTSHVTAEKVAQESLRQSMENHAHLMNIAEQETTCCVFRTAYKIGKHGRPFVDMSPDVDVQQLNGLNMGCVLHSNNSCADILDHIASGMRKKLATDILENKRKICLLIDESTTFSGKSVLVLCLRAAVASDSDVRTFFFYLVELDGTTANDITTAVMECLHKHGFHEEFLRECLIALACDGASVMLGKQAGVAAQLQIRYPGLFVWHCSNHRLELAVGDVMKEISGINHFQIFFDKLYSLYHASPKNQRELRQCAKEIEQRFLVIGRVLSIRWVASSERSVKAVWQTFSSLHQHFSKAAVDQQRDARDRAKYAGLDNILTSCSFLKNVGIMLDALAELSDFSRQLQRNDTTLPDAEKLLIRAVRVFESMVNTPGPYTEEAMEACSSLTFRGVGLHVKSKFPEINAPQFYRSLTENLKTRFSTTKSSHVSTKLADTPKTDSMKLFTQHIKLIYPENWPEDSMDIQYGDKDVRQLCQILRVNVVDSIWGFREYKEVKAAYIPLDFIPLMKAVETIAVSTSERERSFSCMNDLLTPKRNSICTNRLSSLLFLKCVGPPIQRFEPLPYVKTWLQLGRRSADETACRSRNHREEKSPFESMWTLF